MADVADCPLQCLSAIVIKIHYYYYYYYFSQRLPVWVGQSAAVKNTGIDIADIFGSEISISQRQYRPSSSPHCSALSEEYDVHHQRHLHFTSPSPEGRTFLAYIRHFCVLKQCIIFFSLGIILIPWAMFVPISAFIIIIIIIELL